MICGPGTRRIFQKAPTPFLLADALCVRVRFGHQVIKRALLVAVGIDERGYRHILGLTVAAKESEDTWYEFFSSLKERGLSDVKSENHIA